MFEAPHTYSICGPFRLTDSRNTVRGALRQGLEDPAGPTGEIIERLLYTMIPLLKPRSGTSIVPSSTTMMLAVNMLAESLVFHYKVHLTAHDRIRIKTFLDKYLQDGLLTKEPVRTKQWVGAQIVQKVAVAMLDDAVSNGTLDWDVTFNKITSIVLCTALET